MIRSRLLCVFMSVLLVSAFTPTAGFAEAVQNDASDGQAAQAAEAQADAPSAVATGSSLAPASILEPQMLPVDPQPITYEGITFDPWLETTKLPDTAGNYYLVDDVALGNSMSLAPVGTTRLCLNGHTVSNTESASACILLSKDNTTFEVYDNADGGTVQGIEAEGQGKSVSLYLYGGTMTGTADKPAVGVNDANLTIDPKAGKTVILTGGEQGVNMNGGTFTMKGGTISQNDVGVQLENGSVFTMTAGTIANNAELGVYLEDGDCTFALSGSESAITNNGSGVLTGGTFTMTGGTISATESESDSFGVSVFKDGYSSQAGLFAMSGGSISGYGGIGVMVEDGSLSLSGNAAVSGNKGGGVNVINGTLAIEGGSITGNTGGAGLSVTGSRFTMKGSPSINGNTKEGGATSDILLNGGQLITLTGAITGTFGVEPDPGPTPTQRVTFTSGLPSNGALTNFTSTNAGYVIVEGDAGGAAAGEGQFKYAHTHAWKLTAADGVAKLVCEADGCEYITDEEHTVTLSDASCTYDGQAHAVTATKDDGWPGGDSHEAYITVGDVEYYDASGSKLDEAPKAAGTYTAKVKVACDVSAAGTDPLPTSSATEVTAEKEFTIAQKEVGLTWGEADFTYNGQAQKPSATATGIISPDECTVTVSGEQTAANAAGQEYTATATALSNPNYKLPSDVTCTFTIAQRPITISGIAVKDGGKTYDRTDAATLDYSGVTFGNIVSGDMLTVSATGTYADEKAGEDKTVTLTNLALGGDSVANYVLAESGQQATATAAIEPKEVVLTWGDTDFIYNRQAQKPSATATGVISPDECTVTVAGEQTAANAAGQTYTATATVLSNPNYKLPADVTKAFTIAPKEVVVSGIAAEDKVYDGNRTATLVYAGAQFEGIVSGDTLGVSATGTFSDANAGEDKTVSLTDLALSGGAAGNYALASAGQQQTATATIEPKEVALIWHGGSLLYNGEKQVPTADALLLVSGDTCDVTVSGEERNVGSYGAQAIALSNLNYKLPSATASSFPFSITPRSVTVSGIGAEDKTYDGTADVTLNYDDVVLANMVDGDDLSVTSGGTFSDANVGQGKLVGLGSMVLAGEDAGNYVLANSGQQATARASILPKAATVTALSQTVKLNGAIAANVSLATLTGALGGHELAGVSLASTSTAHVTTSGAITPSAAKVVDASGTDMTANYELTYVGGTLTVEPVPAVVEKAPTAAQLTYNTRPQALVSAGRATGGTMMYSLSRDGSYSAQVPTATDAGTYTVWYRVDADADHIGLDPQSVQVTIAKAVPNLGGVTAGTVVDDLSIAAASLKRGNDAVAGTLALVERELQYGTSTYHWMFTPADAGNYLLTSGTVSITVLGHDWAEPVYTWSEGNSSVTALRICRHNATHTETETVGLASVVTTVEPGPVTEGVLTYTSMPFINEAFAVQTATEPIPATGAYEMHRLYNPNSGEHFYTSDEEERDDLVAEGWTYEGVGWTAPVTSESPVYRLYNPYAGEHHYTLGADERDDLVEAGWVDEGVGWFSDDGETVPLYRQYNPYEFACNHNFTADGEERDWLVGLGWLDEGIAWYGV